MDLLGKTLGNYRLVDLIGEGGMGNVYRALHVRLGREVAIKALKPELAHRADIARRFLEEARAVNDIHHPQIVDIYDFMEDLDQQPPLVCMVMELLKGESLARRIARRGALPLPEILEIGRQVTSILEAVHGAKILHRDLKAENIFLLAGEGPPRIKLLDFGSIKSLDEAQQLNLTDPGMALGTPEYMAPEQVMGERLDERTDIYAMGVVLYKMLSGNVPFKSQSYGALMVDVIKTKPPTLASVSTPAYPIPKPLQAVVMRCLHKKPSRRYASMAELREALAETGELVNAMSSPSAGGSDDVRSSELQTGNTAHEGSRSLQRLAQLSNGTPAQVGIGVACGLILVGGLAAWFLSGNGGHSEAGDQAPAAVAADSARRTGTTQLATDTESAAATPTALGSTVVGGRSPADAASAVVPTKAKPPVGAASDARNQSQPKDASSEPDRRQRKAATKQKESLAGQGAGVAKTGRRGPGRRQPRRATRRRTRSDAKTQERTRARPAQSTTVDPFSM